MAANVSASFADGLLSIQGTNGPDQIVVRQVGRNLQVDGVTITGIDGKPTSLVAKAVKSVQIDALGGNDLVWVGDNLKFKVDARGGTGADLFVVGEKSQLTTDKDSADEFVSSNQANVWKQLATAERTSTGQYTLRSMKLGAFKLNNLTASANSAGLSLSGDANLPAVGKVRLTGTLSADNVSYTLTSTPGTVKVGNVTLSNATTRLTEKGLSVAGDADVALFGKVTFTGVIPPKGKYSLEATLGNKSALGGLVQFSKPKLTLTTGGVSVNAEATIAKIGNATFTGTIAANGSYSLKATARINVAGFTVDGAQLTLGSKELEVAFTLPVPSIGKVEFGGSYGPNGWSVKGTYPGRVTIGPVVLKQIGLQVTTDKTAGDRLTLEALGTVAGVDGIVNAKATATIFKDGRLDMNVDAKAVQLGNFSLGSAVVTVSNNNSNRQFVATLKGVIGIAGGPSISLTGIVDAKGNYTLTGTQSVTVSGLTLSNAQFTLTKRSGLTFSAAYNYLTYKVNVTGSATADGRIQFQGTGGTAKLPNGFTLGKVSVSVDLNRPAKSYKMHIEGEANTLVGTAKFSSDTVGNGTSWPTPSLTGTGQIGGALSSLFTGNATFAMESTQIRFEGKLGLKKTPGTSVKVTGTVKSDGTVKVNYTTSAGQWISQQLDKVGNLVREWLYYDAAGKKLQQLRAWAGNKLTDLELYTTSGWKQFDGWLDSSGRWAYQEANASGQLIRQWLYYDSAGQKLREYAAWTGSTLTSLDRYTVSGWKEVRAWVDSRGRWVWQELNVYGQVTGEWLYYDAAGQKLQQSAAWVGGRLTALNVFTIGGVPTLHAYLSDTGDWVEHHYSNGFKTAVRVWNSAGTYLGDQLKNFSDWAARYNPIKYLPF